MNFLTIIRKSVDMCLIFFFDTTSIVIAIGFQIMHPTKLKHCNINSLIYILKKQFLKLRFKTEILKVTASEFTDTGVKCFSTAAVQKVFKKACCYFLNLTQVNKGNSSFIISYFLRYI